MKLVVLVVLFAAAGREARAENPFLPKAINAYENFEFEKALKILRLAEKHVGSTPKDRARVYLYLGLVRFTLGDKPQAEKEFAKALELNYRIRIPQDTSPKIVACFDRVKRSMKPPPDEKTAVTEKKKPDDERVVTTTTTVSTPPRKRLWTWIIAGVGGAALATGATFGYLASEAKSDFDKEPWADKAEDLKKTVESRALTANILFGVGGAAMATALVLYFLEGSAEQLNTDNASALEISPTPLGIKALIRF